MVWYFPLIIGMATAGIPFGWGLLTDKSEKIGKEPYDPNPDSRQFSFIIKLVFFIFKFIGAYFIGVIAFPIALLYHAYKAGKAGSTYKKVMFVVLLLVSLFWGAIAFVIIMPAVS